MKLFHRNKTGETSARSWDSGYEEIIFRSLDEYRQNNRYFYDIKVSTITVYQQEVSTWKDKDKIRFILYILEKVHQYHDTRQYNERYDQEKANVNFVRVGYIKQLLRTKLVMDETDIQQLVTAYVGNSELNWFTIRALPLSYLLNQIQSQYRSKELSELLTTTLEGLKDKLNKIDQRYYEKEKTKWIGKIDDILFNGQNNEDAVKPEKFSGKDPFSEYANKSISSLPDGEKPSWYKLISLSQKASGSRPSGKFLSESKALIKELGNEKFKNVVNDWLTFIVQLKEKEEILTGTYNGRQYRYSVIEFLSSSNTDQIKGFVWMCSHFHNNQTINIIASLAERSFKKIPGKGPAAAAVGNACLYVLYKSKGLDGIGQLSRLKLRIRQNSTQKLIDKYLQQAAKEQGVTISEIEDLSVDDFGLTNGVKEISFDDYTAKIEIEKIGRTSLRWFKTDGTEQKSIPKVVQDKYKAKLKKARETVRQINQTVSAQRDRLDRMFKTDRTWDWENFNSLYLNHGLMSFLVKRLIWNFYYKDKKHTAFFINDNWKTIDGAGIDPQLIESVSLWHPIQSTIAEIEGWRKIISDNRIQQPIKQAFREVYILTDAEIKTRSYSNRMAAHILKQHQFNSLAKIRGWNYALMGAFDDGRYNEAAAIEIPEFGLKAEYWINEVNADDAFNDTGIWFYIATDQVRFINTQTNNTVDLVDVPEILFSEILRDVDLFVGVASIGNDPTWQDSGGLPRYNNYWQSYSFGELSEIAKTRKGILENLIPRLKISNVTTIQDRFVVVKGKLRTYKIHIGSTNILMEPNDQYLCIVPDRSKNTGNTDVFLPFEGDTGLSLIISKAFLLADDDKITDSTITSQINRK